MNARALDPLLAEALAEMSMANWMSAQKVLAARLERVHELGDHRLNLFLLSVAAASGGYPEVANTLWPEAKSAALDESTPRYLDLQLAPNDPRQKMLLDLERAWWDFNGWNGRPPDAGTTPAKEVEIDWDFVVDATLRGDDAGLEGKYGALFSSHSSEAAFLWNLLALAYLQAGDVRTYDEMVGNRPPQPAPGSLPEELVEALDSRGLERAREALERGEWLTNVALFEAREGPVETPRELSAQEWKEGMRAGFYELYESRFLDAARKFQKVNSATTDRQRLLLGLNALCLTYFRLGDYTQCEKVYLEFQNLLQAFPLEPGSILVQDYLQWLGNVGAAPENEHPYFNPFVRSDWNESVSLESGEMDFWKEFQTVVNLLAEDDHAAALSLLQRLEVATGATLDSFQRYLLTLMFLAGAVLAGDYAEVQELTEEAFRLEQSALFPSDRCEEVADALRWAGFEKLSQRIGGGAGARSTPLNPWEDLAVLRA